MRARIHLWGAAVVCLVSGACASATTGPRPFPTPARPRPAAPAAEPPGAPEPGGDAIARLALSLLGTPYRAGGTDPTGFDCSGFVDYVFAQYSVPLPRTVGDLAHEGQPVEPTDIRAGDLVFFSTVAPGPSHVGIALGDGTFVHAPNVTGEVRIERLGSPYWATRLVGVRRMW
jgi:cell wall-associated NlpC family hydrolase